MSFLGKYFKLKVTIFGVICLIILCCFGYILDNETKNTSADEEEFDDSSQTYYENMIYKGGTLPIPYSQDYVVLTSLYNPQRVHPITGRVTAHRGIDIVSFPRGCDILAVADGIVTISGFDDGGYGNWVEIRHNINGRTIYTRYGHMRDRTVAIGENVVAGTVIGHQGNTGGSTGEHLHFEVRLDSNANGYDTNPLPYLLGVETVPTQSIL